MTAQRNFARVIPLILTTATMVIAVLIVLTSGLLNNTNRPVPDHYITINHAYAVNYFRELKGLIIVSGPRALYSKVYQRLTMIGLQSHSVYVGPNLSEALMLMKARPGSILIIDLPYLHMNAKELGILLTPYVGYGVIAFYNGTETQLQNYTLYLLLYYEYLHNRANGHYLAFLPHLRGGPPFTVEAISGFGNTTQVSIGYRLSLRGLMYVLYEETHDQFDNPCAVSSTSQLNLPGGTYYESPRFNDYASPYSDSQVSEWYYDFCIYYPSGWSVSAVNSQYFNIFPYGWMYVQPQSSYSAAYNGYLIHIIDSMGLANDYSSSWIYYSKSGGLGSGVVPIAGPELYESPQSQSSATSYELQIYDEFTQALVDLIEVLIDAVSDPVSITNVVVPVVSGVYANDTWSMLMNSPAYGDSFQMGVGDMASVNLPSQQTQPYYIGYLPVDGNFTVYSQPFASGPTECVDYYYYAIQLQWYIIYGTGTPPTLSFNNQNYIIWTPATEGTNCYRTYPH